MMDNGEDIIFATGAPGSKWSAVLRSLSYNIDVNTTDEKEDRSFSVILNDETTGESKKLAWHKGCYWGPYHQFGHKFDKIDKLSKDEILHEIRSAYDNFDGIKVVKSHWFSYNLDFLIETFPAAKIIAVYLPDDVCFDWWHVIGGWDITYPIYNWYENDERMKKQIKEENSHLIRFFAEKNIPMNKYFDIMELYGDLSLTKKFKEINSDSFNEFVDEYNLNGKEQSFSKTVSRRISKTMLGVYNPKKHSNKNYYENVLERHGPEGYKSKLRYYKNLKAIKSND